MGLRVTWRCEELDQNVEIDLDEVQTIETSFAVEGCHLVMRDGTTYAIAVSPAEMKSKIQKLAGRVVPITGG